MVNITGTNGAEVLRDGANRDQLTALAGADIFELTVDGKTDFILDFENGIDRIDLRAFNVNWGQVQVSIKTASKFVVNTGGEKFFVTFQGASEAAPVTLADLTEDDFIFNTNAGSPPANVIEDRPVTKEHFGTSGTDIFLMVKDYSRDVVKKFDPTKDKIDLTAFDLTFADLEIVTRKPGKVLVKLGTEGLVIRDLSRSMTAEDVTADLFIF